MSPTLDPWRCTGTRYRHVRTGDLSPAFTGGTTFTPKAAVQGGLVTVDTAALQNYDQHGPSSYVYKVGMGTVMPGQNTFSRTAIDNMLDSMGAATMTLRVQAGGSAPGWLKDILGRITIQNSQLGITAEITKFWDPIALDAWDRLIRQLAVWYNDDPRVVLVSADFAMTLYSEPLILGGHGPSGIAMFEAGLNETTMRNAILVSTASTCEAFNKTRVEFAGHSSWQRPVSTGIVDSWPPARTLMNELYAAHGNQLTLTSYGLDSTDYAVNFPAQPMATATNYYSYMRGWKAAGARIGFQLTLGAGQAHTGQDRADGAQNAADFGGDFVEHSSWGTITTDTPGGSGEITRLDSLLKTNAGY